MRTGRVNLVRDLLDKQLVGRRQERLGKVDGIVLELADGKPPRLARLEVGGVTLAGRLHPRLARWILGWARRWSPTRGEAFRIPWSKVREVGVTVSVALDAEKTPALAWEHWLRRHVIRRIPGGGR